MTAPFSNRGEDAAPAPPRRVVASYDSYADAERAVDHLADQRFPVDRVSIVGRDLKLVERVTGRTGYARSALDGALSGALAGVLIGWLFTVFDWSSPVVARGWLILDGLWFGAVVGLLYGLLAHALTGGRRDFTSVGAMQADHYDVVVDEDVAEEAARKLKGLPEPLDRHDPRFDRERAAAPTASPERPAHRP